MSAGWATRRSGVFASFRARPSSPRRARDAGGPHHAGRDRVDPHPGRPELDRRRADQRHEPGLRGAVRGVAGRRRETGDRRHEGHDPARAGGEDAAAELHRQVGVPQHDVEVPVPVVVVDVEQRRVPCHPHDVHQAVEATERPGHLVEDPLGVVAAAGVPRDGHALHLVGDLPGPCRVDVDARDVCPDGREGVHGLASDPLPGTHHDEASAVEAEPRRVVRHRRVVSARHRSPSVSGAGAPRCRRRTGRSRRARHPPGTVRGRGGGGRARRWSRSVASGPCPAWTRCATRWRTGWRRSRWPVPSV